MRIEEDIPTVEDQSAAQHVPVGARAKDLGGGGPERLGPQAMQKLARRLEVQGVIFQTVPETIYPGMAFVTADDIVERGETGYSISYISKLVRRGEIDAVQVGGATLITPRGFEQLLERSQRSKAGELQRGRRPGPVKERKPRRQHPRHQSVSDPMIE